MAFFTANQLEALSAGMVRVAFLFEFRFASQTVRAWNGNHAIASGGSTWLPLKGSCQIDGLVLEPRQESSSVEFIMNGLPDQDPDLLAQVLSETDDVIQRLVIVHLQLFDSDWQTVGDPIGIWWGFMQPPQVDRTPMRESEGGSQSVRMAAENAFFNRARPPHGRYTDRDQQARSSGDKFFQFVALLQFKVITYPDY